MTEEQIEHMVTRFLCWELPEDFTPDAGISFNPVFNEGTPYENRHQPQGTNLFDANQAEAMIRHMIEGLPSASDTPSREEVEALIDRLGKDVFYGEERAHKMRKHNPLHMDAIDTLRALLAQRERDEKVTVKPLEWIEPDDGTYHDVQCQYEIEADGDGLWRVTRGVTGGTSYFGHFRSRDAAKAAAQADYERRILSALAARNAGGE